MANQPETTTERMARLHAVADEAQNQSRLEFVLGVLILAFDYPILVTDPFVEILAIDSLANQKIPLLQLAKNAWSDCNEYSVSPHSTPEGRWSARNHALITSFCVTALLTPGLREPVSDLIHHIEAQWAREMPTIAELEEAANG